MSEVGCFRGRGAVPGYSWIEDARADMLVVLPALRRFVAGRCVLVTAFDSGPMRATAEDIAQGWCQLPSGAASPPLGDGVDVPWHEFDEWWIFSDVEAAAAFPEIECFVNHHGWAMRSPAELTASFDPTWERDVFDWLPGEQARFWRLIEAHRPLVYASSGDRLVLVSSLPELLADVQERIERQAYPVRRI